MAELLQNQIQNAVSSMSLDDFLEWFVPLSCNIEQSGEPSAISLAHRIDGILGEASSAGWSDYELREELAEAIRPFVQYAEDRYGDSRQISQSNAGSGAVNQAVAA